MDLLYYYPDKNDAPAEVGKSVIKELVNYKDQLPFDEIKLIQNNNKDETNILNLDTINYSEVFNYPKEYFIHIPISPSIMPNKKFALHIYSIIEKKPLVIHYHGDFRRHIKMQLKYCHRLDYLSVPSSIFAPYILRNTRQVVTHSYSLDKIVKNNYKVKNSVIIPNGIDNYWFHPLTDLNFSKFDHIINEDSFKIFYHGRLAPEKGIDLLIKAFSKFSKDNPKTVLYIAGEGEYKRNLISLCKLLKISEKVFFLGNLSKEHIKFFLKTVDIAIYPSRFDAFCLAVMEAFACSNCPVSFSKNAGVYDFVVEDGYQLNSFEPILENIINILTSQYRDPDEQVVNLQKDIANKYKWNLIVKKYIDLYWKLFSDKRKFT